MAYAPLTLFSVLFHLYVGWRVAPALAAWPGWQAAFAVLMIMSATIMPMGLLARRVRSQPASDLLSWAGLIFMGLFSSLFVLTVARDAVLLAAWLLLVAIPRDGAMAVLAQWSGIAVPVLGLLVTLLGFVNARRTAAVTTVDIPLRDLPEALHGFTVAQISDIHVGPTIKVKYLQAIVKKVNALQADMVAVTGDLVDGSVRELSHHVAPLAALISTHGTFFVTGNHEYYSGADAWIVELRRLGVRVLMNEHVVLRHGEAALVVAGVADWSAHHFDESHRSDPHAAIAGAPDNAPVRMLLAHQPRSATAAAEAGFNLQLSGHTHGGQFFPWNLFVRFQQPFTAGLHRLKDLWVYTSRGTGYWGPPKRFCAPSEITHLRLVAARPLTL
ncbi:metallophosphoesterase [soil metagenome]